MIDPITLEVLRHRFFAIAEEMGAALFRTSYSTTVKFRRDASCAVFDRNGDTIAQAAHIPIHLGVLASSVKGALKYIKAKDLQPGDAIIQNDPYIGGSHLPDVTVFSPVFYGSELLGFVGNIAHHIDLGGMVPGSVGPDSTEIFQEGLRIPPMKLIRAGNWNEDLVLLHQYNVRTPYEGLGDLRAQVAANNVGERRFIELCDEIGKEMIFKGITALADYCERRMQSELSHFPDGNYSFVDILEGDGITNDPISIAVNLKIENGKILIDFQGSSPQSRGPVNAVRAMTMACVFYVVKAITDPTIPPNVGTFRCIDVKMPESSIVNASFPAPTGQGNTNTTQRIVDALLGAFAQAVPDRVCAACTGSMNALHLNVFDTKTRSYNTYIETCGGGYGATSTSDGESGIHTHMTNTLNTPIEVLESTMPVKLESYGLIPDSEGPGCNRGGLGIIREFLVEADELDGIISSERNKNGPWGLFGGGPARGTRFRIVRDKGQVEELSSKCRFFLKKGEKFILETAGGGGWGNPQSRSRSQVQEDVLEGIISLDRARSVYGLESPENGKERTRDT
jgi:N-methylhydantoinase B